MTNKIKIPVGSVEETLIIPLYGRKIATEAYPFFFKDEEASRIIDNLDYDFSSLEKKGKNFFYRFGILELAMRQMAMSIEAADYIKAHPGCACVNLGCGLDTTLERLEGDFHIYNTDFPDVIKARESLIGKKENATNLSYDLKDYGWMDSIEAEKGVIFLASGVFYYFLKEEVKSLLIELGRVFPEGVIVFDSGSKKAVKTMNKTYLKKTKMKVSSFFYLEDPGEEITPWSSSFVVSSKGYMLGYLDFSKDRRVPWLHRKLAKLADGKSYRMKIVKVIL